MANLTSISLCVTLARAAELLGGDKPLSRSTVQRMIAAGVLDARGAGRVRRITTASIHAYLNGDRLWPNDGAGARAASTRIKTANGGVKSRSATGAPGAVVRLVARTPNKKREP